MAQGRIPDSDIQAIRERAAIDEIVGEYVQLKNAGHDSLTGLSPFKDEKTPSCHVRPQRGAAIITAFLPAKVAMFSASSWKWNS